MVLVHDDDLIMLEGIYDEVGKDTGGRATWSSVLLSARKWIQKKIKKIDGVGRSSGQSTIVL